MSAGEKWSDEDVDELERLWAAGLSDIEIAEVMGRTRDAISTRRGMLGISTPQAASRRDLQPVWFPQFEDVTKAEARKIREGVKDSAPVRRPEPRWGASSCSAMLVYT